MLQPDIPKVIYRVDSFINNKIDQNRNRHFIAGGGFFMFKSRCGTIDFVRCTRIESIPYNSYMNWI